jgi:hypothetical protein
MRALRSGALGAFIAMSAAMAGVANSAEAMDKLRDLLLPLRGARSGSGSEATDRADAIAAILHIA